MKITGVVRSFDVAHFPVQGRAITLGDIAKNPNFWSVYKQSLWL
ncbi:unnamed protein product [Brugia pahangi]|uniref:ABC transporter ATP-binding protein n=1 Tax=Brugia pahangi TaxID=6280 RepID=A0A0N4SY53_BRUPA|nr:unnamed protein product [Brugia pahangi]